MKLFTKKYYLLSAVVLLAAVSVIAVRCKKPTEGIQINVNTADLFHFVASVQVVDPSGSFPNNLSVQVTGTNAAAVYGMDGKKALSAPLGFIAIGIHPKMEPTATAPLSFNLVITGPGYVPLTIPVTISSKDSTKIIKAKIFNLTVPTAGVASTTATASTSGGTVTAPIVVSTPTTSAPQATSVTVPAGTKLQDANGNTINASSVAVTVNNFNTSQSGVVDLFPGSSLATDNLIDNSGNKTSAVLIPAGFVNIQMDAGGTEVKKFSNPISLSMTLDNTFKNPTTGATLAAGQQMDIYSYDTGTAQWKFEQTATVSNVGGNMVVNFTTTHLTFYSAVIKLAQNKTLNVTINTTGSNQILPGQNYPITITAAFAPDPTHLIATKSYNLDPNSLNLDLGGALPVVSTIPITLTVYSGSVLTAGNIIGTGTLNASTNALSLNITLPNPGPTTDLVLKLDCTGSNSKVGLFTPPNFVLYYKPTGALASAYALLGQVNNGELITNTLLSGVKYDFLANYNSHTKEVINHDISENIPANQIIGGNNFLGTHAGAKTFNALSIKNLCDDVNTTLTPAQ